MIAFVVAPTVQMASGVISAYSSNDGSFRSWLAFATLIGFNLTGALCLLVAAVLLVIDHLAGTDLVGTRRAAIAIFALAGVAAAWSFGGAIDALIPGALSGGGERIWLALTSLAAAVVAGAAGFVALGLGPSVIARDKERS